MPRRKDWSRPAVTGLEQSFPKVRWWAGTDLNRHSAKTPRLQRGELTPGAQPAHSRSGWHGRGGRIRTGNLWSPRPALNQGELHPDHAIQDMDERRGGRRPRSSRFQISVAGGPTTPARRQVFRHEKSEAPDWLSSGSLALLTGFGDTRPRSPSPPSDQGAACWTRSRDTGAREAMAAPGERRPRARPQPPSGLLGQRWRRCCARWSCRPRLSRSVLECRRYALGSCVGQEQSLSMAGMSGIPGLRDVAFQPAILEIYVRVTVSRGRRSATSPPRAAAQATCRSPVAQ